MSKGYVRLIVKTSKYRARINSRSKQIHIGNFDSEEQAWEAISDYRRVHYHELIDLSRIAKDPIAWSNHSRDIIKKLSNLPNASKVEPPIFSKSELEEWL